MTVRSACSCCQGRPTTISDHSLIVALFEVTDHHPARTCCRHVVKRRPLRSFNFDAFATDLEESELVRNPQSDVIQLFGSYNSTLADLIDKHAPLRDVNIRARPTAPWFDAECHGVKVKTRRLENAHRRQPSTESWTKWRPLLRPGSNATSQLTADDYVQFFTMNIDRIRTSTATAPYPILEERHVPDPLSAFEPATAEEILIFQEPRNI